MPHRSAFAGAGRRSLLRHPRIEDGNDLASPALVEARAKGDVLIVEPGVHGWVEVPPFTGELKYAKSLLPDGLYTISSEPQPSVRQPFGRLP